MSLRPRRLIRQRLTARLSIPTWVIIIFSLVGTFNVIIFLTIVMAFWRPDTVPVPLTGDVVIGLHLQLFEAFLAALAIGLAVFGFVGYAAIREAAERRAEEATRAMMTALQAQPMEMTQTPDLSGLSDSQVRTERERGL